MKKFLCLTIVVSLLFAGSSSAQNKAADERIQKIFTIIKSNDEDGFVKLFPSYENVLGLAQEWARQLTDSVKKTRAINGLNEFTKEFYTKEIAKELERFQQLLHRGRAKGINWPEIQFVNAHYQEQEMRDEILQASTFEGYFAFTFDTSHYFIDFRDMAWYKPKDIWIGVRATLTDPNDGEAMNMRESLDSMAVYTDTITAEGTPMVPPPPPALKSKSAVSTQKFTSTPSQPEKKTNPASHPAPAIKPKNKLKP